MNSYIQKWVGKKILVTAYDYKSDIGQYKVSYGDKEKIILRAMDEIGVLLSNDIYIPWGNIIAIKPNEEVK